MRKEVLMRGWEDVITFLAEYGIGLDIDKDRSSYWSAEIPGEIATILLLKYSTWVFTNLETYEANEDYLSR